MATELRAAIPASLKKIEKGQRDHPHPQEPEARLMPCEGWKDPAYNALAVAGDKARIIVAQSAVNGESDIAQLRRPCDRRVPTARRGWSTSSRVSTLFGSRLDAP